MVGIVLIFAPKYVLMKLVIYLTLFLSCSLYGSAQNVAGNQPFKPRYFDTSPWSIAQATGNLFIPADSTRAKFKRLDYEASTVNLKKGLVIYAFKGSAGWFGILTKNNAVAGVMVADGFRFKRTDLLEELKKSTDYKKTTTANAASCGYEVYENDHVRIRVLNEMFFVTNKDILNADGPMLNHFAVDCN